MTEPASETNQVESLANIAAEAAVLEAGPGSQPFAENDAAPVQPSPQVNEVDEISATLQLIRAMGVPAAPAHVQADLTKIWDDDTLRRVAEAVVKLCQVYNWTVSDFFGRYGPHFALVVALAGPTIQTIQLLKKPAPAAAAPNNGQQQQA